MKRFYLVLLSLFTVFAPAFAAESVKYNKELMGLIIHLRYRRLILTRKAKI